ncbi:hypothetical protein LJC16_01085 [Bacteroidales bacterium OttesenSCG-928-C19]|nr:hypothetical protein [Bacteroidales bacterium OttesenSCG-928-C19]
MKKSFLYAAFAMILFGSCFPERQLAVDYVEKFSNSKHEPVERIYVVLPEEVIHTNKKLSEIEGFFDMDVKTQDDLIRKNTKFVDKINDSIFLTQFKDHLIYNLGRIGIPVIIETNPDRLPQAVSNQIFILRIPQMEVEEYIEDKTVEYVTGGGHVYEASVPQNKFNVNIWYHFDKDSDTTNAPAYFYHWVFTDRVSNSLERDAGGNLKLRTKVEELNMNDVYASSYLTGKLTATYFIEKIVNDYVKSQKGSPSYYYFYNPEKNKITNDEVPYYYGVSTFKEVK